MKYAKCLVMMTMVTLGGCLSPVKMDENTSYVLNTVPHLEKSRYPTSATILVLQPDTRPIYNTTQMAYTDKPYQVAYFGKNQWAETPSQMLLPLMVQSLQNTHYFRAVLTPPYSGRYAYLLSTQIVALQQNLLRHPSVLEFSIRAQLTRIASNQLIASKQFTVTVPMTQASPYSGVIAANRATSKVLAELTSFCLQHVH